MLIKALQPLKIRLPDGIHVLYPGQSYELTEHHALKLLAKAPDKVRRAEPTPTQWLDAWDELAQATSGITREDSRFNPVMDALDRCDRAFEQGDWMAFQKDANQVKALINVTEGEQT